MKNLVYKVIDVMKQTKDQINNQLNVVEVRKLLNTIKSANVTHIAIAIPFDSNADFIANGTTPAPLTAENHYKMWCDEIHALGLKVLHRGTWCGTEAIWGFDFWKPGTDDELDAGTRASAPTDGSTTWLGKNYKFIVDNPSFFAAGDIWAPIPEPTNNVFNGNFFLPVSTEGFADFFIDLKRSSDDAFAAIGKNVVTGMSANNYSEIRSGWIPQRLFDAVGVIAVDYYGNYNNGGIAPLDYDEDFRVIFSQRGNKPIFWQEWGDLHNNFAVTAAAQKYVIDIYRTLTTLTNDGLFVGFNYWGGWDGQDTSILKKNTSGDYLLNCDGQILAYFFNSDNPVNDQNVTETACNFMITTPPPTTGGGDPPPTNPPPTTGQGAVSKRISELQEITNAETINPTDYFPVVDQEDTLQSPQGSTKKVRFNLLAGILGRRGELVVASLQSSTWRKLTADVVCDGVSDNVQIQELLNLAGAGNSIFLLPGEYRLDTFLHINKMGIRLYGVKGSTRLVLNDNKNVDVIRVGTSGTSIKYVKINDLLINGNRANQTAGNGIHLYGAQYCDVDNCVIEEVKQWGILADGTSEAGFGYNNTYTKNTIDTSGGAFKNNNSEAETLMYNQFKFASGVAAEDSWNRGLVRIASGGCFIGFNVFGNGGDYPEAALLLQNSLPSRVIGNRFDITPHEAIQISASGQVIQGNDFGSCCHLATANSEDVISVSSMHNLITGNSFYNTFDSAYEGGAAAATYNWRNCIRETGAADYNKFSVNKYLEGHGESDLVTVIGANTTST